ncbi:hypothetical protein EDD11_005770 [Mortierella claussenii]|nr:hypothetical protein EDD11_005770 [Mortierella claussenii]
MHKLPRQVKTRNSIEEYMVSYSGDSKKYIDGGGVTETDLLRAGYVAFSIGTGITVDVDVAEETLLQEAPITRNGRLGLPMFSASGFEISSFENYDTDANTEFFKYWDEQVLFNYASPVPIQSAMAALFTSGIAKFERGMFDEIDLSSASGKVTFQGREFDALLSPRSITRNGDFILSAAKGHVKEVVSGLPDYGKGGYFQTTTGKPINAFDAGMGGSGIKVPSKKGGPNPPMRTAGVRWDALTNNHYAATVFATHHAYNTLALAIAFCLEPTTSPIETVTQIYRDILPTTTSFDQEVRKFKPDWDDLQERLLFLRLAARAAKDDVAHYYEITDKIFSKETRKSFLDDQSQKDKDFYDKQHSLIKSYDPSTRDQYEQRFADYTTLQYKAILEKIFNRAGANTPELYADVNELEYDRNYALIF